MTNIEEYLEFCKSFYTRDYFSGHKGNGANYIEGFGGDWYKDIANWLNSVLEFKDKKVLDAGCACGAFLNAFREFGASIVGVDVSQFAVTEAMWNLGASACIIHSSIHDLSAIEDNSIDLYFSMETFEHVHQELASSVVSEMHRVLKPGGIAFVQSQTGDHGRDLINDKDDGHISILPESFWTELYDVNNFESCDYLVDALRNSETGFIAEYKWKYLIYRK